MLWKVFSRVFRKPSYIILAILTALIVFDFAIIIPNYKLIWSVLGVEGPSINDKLSMLWTLVYTATPIIYFISILFGINISLTIFFFHRRLKAVGEKGIWASTTGIFMGFLGIGCASCGSLFLVGNIGVLGALPFLGVLFSILSIILLALSIYITAKRIHDPLVCEVDNYISRL